MIFMALGTLPPPLLPSLPLPHQRGLPAGCLRPLRRAINTKDELLEGSHVLVALGSSVRNVRSSQSPHRTSNEDDASMLISNKAQTRGQHLGHGRNT